MANIPTAAATSAATQPSAGAKASTAISTGTSPAKKTPPAGIAENFQAFLTLLTTQLRNQNPLEPLNANDFTQQLVQFASVEQQLRTNDTLGALLSSAKAANTATALGFVGSQVTADGASARLTGNSGAEWRLNVPRAAREAKVTIRDGNGTIVHEHSKPLQAGAQTYAWDGRTAGGFAPAGDYTIAVAGIDATGAPLPVTTEVTGRVDSVDLTGAEPFLRIGNASVAMSKARSIAK